MKRHGTLFVLALALAVAAYAAADSHTAKVGAAAPGFTLNDETGKPHALSDYRGKIVVLEWTNPECPFVKRHYQAGTMKNLDEQFGENVVWLAVNSSHFNEPEDSVKWRSENGFAYPTLQDPDGEVGRLYGAKTTPHMFVVDASGTLRYNGAIDDRPHGDAAGADNYVLKVVSALEAGTDPAVSATKPYGCSVKYAKK